MILVALRPILMIFGALEICLQVYDFGGYPGGPRSNEHVSDGNLLLCQVPRTMLGGPSKEEGAGGFDALYNMYCYSVS